MIIGGLKSGLCWTMLALTFARVQAWLNLLVDFVTSELKRDLNLHSDSLCALPGFSFATMRPLLANIWWVATAWNLIMGMVDRDNLPTAQIS